MKIIRLIPLAISVAALCVLVAVTGSEKQQRKAAARQTVTAQTKAEPKKAPREMRGVWVTYMDLDMQNTDMSRESFKKRFRHIADTAKKDKFNTLIVQVRPFCDALYRSSYYPSSHILSGKQGKYAGYDALEYMCAYTHKLGMELHAWVNPYRVRSSATLKLSADNPYKKNPSLGVKVGNGIYLNPALPKVRELIENGVKEIVQNYNVDGIQFDDYFYPTDRRSFDGQAYREYSEKASEPLPLDKWRINNVNILVAEVHDIVHSVKKNVVFGISPQGNIDNDYRMYADVKSWCSQSGYVDYICPQLYYSLENPALKFGEALRNWLELDYDGSVTLYAGIAGYKTGTDSDGGTWNSSDRILQKEVNMLRKSKVSGFMFYTYSNLESEAAAREVANLIKVLD